MLETFGFVAVTTMVISYGLEERSSGYIVLFALGCGMAATYALLIESYAFFVAESVWCLIAFRRYWRQAGSSIFRF